MGRRSRTSGDRTDDGYENGGRAPPRAGMRSSDGEVELRPLARPANADGVRRRPRASSRVLARAERAAPGVVFTVADQGPWLFAAVVGLITLMRIIALLTNRLDLAPDEARLWMLAREPFFGLAEAPPVPQMVTALFTALFGESPAALRLSSPVLDGVTALVLGAIGTRAFSSRTGILAGLLWLTLPQVAFQANLAGGLSALTLGWSLALLAVFRLLDRTSPLSGLMLGLSLGFCANAAPAGLVLIPVIVLVFLAHGAARWVLFERRLWVAFVLAIISLVPGAMASRDFGGGSWLWQMGHERMDALTLFLRQFLGLGPLILVALLFLALRGRRRGASLPEHLALGAAFLPLLAALGLAMTGRAGEDLAALCAPGAALAVAGYWDETARGRRWLRLDFALQAAVAVVLSAGPVSGGRLSLGFIGQPYGAQIGWREFGQDLLAVVERARARTLLFERSDLFWEMAYELRGTSLALAMIRPVGVGHFWSPGLPQPALRIAEPGNELDPALPLRLVGEGPFLTVAPAVSSIHVILAQPVRW